MATSKTDEVDLVARSFVFTITDMIFRALYGYFDNIILLDFSSTRSMEVSAEKEENEDEDKNESKRKKGKK